MIALVGQVCAHAGTISPSAIGRFSLRALIRTASMRCTQKVHFSITPRARTVTSGLNCIIMEPSGAVVSGLNHREIEQTSNVSLSVMSMSPALP